MHNHRRVIKQPPSLNLFVDWTVTANSQQPRKPPQGDGPPSGQAAKWSARQVDIARRVDRQRKRKREKRHTKRARDIIAWLG